MGEITSPYAGLKAILLELHELLEKYGDDRQASAGCAYLQRAIVACEAGGPHARDALNAVEIWGGSGSIRDLILVRSQDDIKKSELLVRLRNEMIKSGNATVQVASIAV